MLEKFFEVSQQFLKIKNFAYHSSPKAPKFIYGDVTNQLFALSPTTPEIGSIRETFFLSMLSGFHEITLPLEGDFLIDHKYLFEVGGRNKSGKQIQGKELSFLAYDDIEIGVQKKIPLWLFGFLY